MITGLISPMEFDPPAPKEQSLADKNKRIYYTYTHLQYKKQKVTKQIAEHICRQLVNGKSVNDIAIKLEPKGISFKDIDNVRKGVLYRQISKEYKLKNKPTKQIHGIGVFSDNQVRAICQYFIDNDIDSLTKLDDEAKCGAIVAASAPINFTTKNHVYQLYIGKYYSDISREYSYRKANDKKPKKKKRRY